MKTSSLFLFSACLFMMGCSSHQAEQIIHSVKLTHPERMEEMSCMEFTGIVREGTNISLGFKTPGQIVHIAVNEGDFVYQGQLIASLDDIDYRLGVEALQIQYDQLSDEVKRLEQLYKGKSVSTNDYEKAVAGLKQLGVQLQVNKNKLDYTQLTAPVNGYVREVNFDESEMVDAGTPIISLMDVNDMEVEVNVPVIVLRNKDCLESITCRAIGTKGELMFLKLLSLVPKADATQLYRMRLGFVDKPDKQLTAGMNVQIELRFLQANVSRRHLLPLASIFQGEEGASYVWTLGNDSIINKVKVQVKGVDSNGFAEVLGLTGDENVVRAGVHALQEGEKVKVIGEPSETNVGGLL